MVELLKEVEATPASYPDIEPRWMWQYDPELGDQDPGSDQVWVRIEAYIRTRYTPREVVWTIEGRGGDEWVPPLSPVLSQSAERWTGDEWGSVALLHGPLGLYLPCDGVFRITAQLGGGDVPAGVQEAFRRLHEYARGIAEDYKADASSFQNRDSQRPVHWTGRALQLSGAADVLRPYRRQK